MFNLEPGDIMMIQQASEALGRAYEALLRALDVNDVPAAAREIMGGDLGVSLGHANTLIASLADDIDQVTAATPKAPDMQAYFTRCKELDEAPKNHRDSPFHVRNPNQLYLFPPCGCTIEGDGVIPDPIRIKFCLAHARTAVGAPPPKGVEATGLALLNAARTGADGSLLESYAVAYGRAYVKEKKK